MNKAEKSRRKKTAEKAAGKAKPGKAARRSPGQRTQAIQESLLLALRHHARGRLPEAEGIYRRILRADPDQPVASHFLGVIARQKGDPETAVDLIARALAVKPDYAEGHNSLGNVHKDLGRLDDAVASYRKALAIKADFTDAHLNLGNALRDLGSLEDAVASYGNALALEPEYAEAQNNLGTTLQQLGRLDEAIASYHRVLASIPDSAPVHNNLGTALQRTGKLEDALACFERALAIDPQSARAHYNMGTVLQGLGRLEKAVDSFDSAATDMARVKALECLYGLGRYDEFYRRLDRFMAADRTNIGVAALSAFVSDQLGREDPYPFCKTPLDFIRVGTIGDSPGEIEDLSDRLIEDLKRVKTDWEPYGVTTRSGFQTPGNLFSDPKGSIAELDRIIRAEIDSYHSEYKSADCSFMDSWPGEIRLSGWFVHLFGGGHQDVHNHTEGWVSGVIYLKLPEAPKDEEGCIEFGLNGYDFPLLKDEYPSVLHRPRLGEIVLFPSSLFHKTVAIATEEERMSVSFDLLPR